MYKPQFLVYLYDTPILVKSNRRGKNSRFRQKIPHFLSDIPGPLSPRERDGGCRFYSGRQSPRSYRTPTVRGVSCETSLFRLAFARNEKKPAPSLPFLRGKTARTTWFCYRWSRFFNSERVVRSANSATPERATMPQAAQITEGHSTFAQPNSKNTGGSRQNPALTTK